MSAELLKYVQLNATNEPEPLLDLNDEDSFFIEAKSFTVIPPTKQQVMAQDNRRWGGGRQVAETHENGAVEWVAGVAGASGQACLVKAEELLAQIESNPYSMLLMWQPPGASEPTLYEVRGTAIWTPKYEWAQFAGASLFLFSVHVPVAPLALGLPVRVLKSSATELPAVLTLTGIPGDAPAKAEVSIETGAEPTPSFIKGASGGTSALATDATHIYWASHTGYIGRALLTGGSIETTWLHVEGESTAVAVDATYVYWTDTAAGKLGRAPIGGGATEWYPYSLPSPLGIAVSSTHIYWAESTLGTIARAPIAGGVEINRGWLATSTTGRIAVDANYIYWGNETYLGRCLLTSPGSPEEWIKGVSVVALAVSANYVYWTPGFGEYIARADISGTEVNPTWVAIKNGESLATGGGYIYWGVYSPAVIGRASTGGSPPIWALMGWAAKPASGLAAAPFGLLDSSEVGGSGGWSYTTLEGARGGKCLVGNVTEGYAFWNIDPATMVADSFSGELAVEVWARMYMSPGTAIVTLSATPQDGTGYGAARYTDEWGSAGRPLVASGGAYVWRMTRLGTLHLLVNPLAPRVWGLSVQASISSLGYQGLDYLLVVPATQRACSPSSKPNGASYPGFIVNVAPTVKTIHHDLTALVSKPGKYGHPDHGLGGQLLDLPPGETDMLLKLSSLVPDDPTVNNASEQTSHEAKVTVTVTPRYFIARTA